MVWNQLITFVLITTVIIFYDSSKFLKLAGKTNTLNLIHTGGGVFPPLGQQASKLIKLRNETSRNLETW